MQPAARAEAPSGSMRGPLLAVVALALLAWRDWLTAPADHGLATADFLRYFNWIHAFVRDRLLSGHLPLWNPYNYAGHPFAANPQVTLFYPPSWIHLALPLPVAHRIMVVGHVALAGVAMALFLRRLELRAPAVLAGVLPWMLGSYLSANAVVGHLPMVFTASWLPLVLWCYEGALRSGRMSACVATGAALGVQVLAGEPQNSYYTGLALTTWAVVRHARVGGAREVAKIGLPGLLTAGVVAALLAAIQLVPTVEMMLHSDRLERSYQFAASSSFEPASALGLLLPWSSSVRLLVDLRDGQPVPLVNLGWEHAMYVGILTLVLATAARSRLSVSIRPAQVLLLVGCVLGLGQYTPLYRPLVTVLPGLSLFRVPSRALVLVVFALSVLAAHGLQTLLSEARLSRWRWIMLVMLVLTAAAWVVALHRGLPVLEGDTLDRAPGVVEGTLAHLTLSDAAGWAPLAALLLAAAFVALLPRMRGAVLGPAAVGLLALDLLVAQPQLPLKPVTPETERQVLWLLLLRDRTSVSEGPFRVDLAPGHQNALAALGARVENVNGYWPVALHRLYRYVHAMRGVAPDPHTRHQIQDSVYASGHPHSLPLLNVRFASVMSDGAAPGQQSFSLAPVAPWLPRAWVVDRAETVADDDAALRRVTLPQFNAYQTVILESDPAQALEGSGMSPGTAHARRVDDAVLEIETETVRDGYLVLSEIHYPGWKATVDGHAVPLHRADYILTALRLPAGRHLVRYAYEPASVQVGAALTAFTLLGLGGLRLTRHRRRR